MCNNADVLSVFKTIKTVITIIKIVVPFILTISLMTNYTSALKSGDSNLLSNANKNAVPKMIAALLIFLIPTFINVIASMSYFDNNKYLACISDATDDGIKAARVDEVRAKIDNLKKNFSRANYNSARVSINKIKDEETKKALMDELEGLEKYVVIMEALNLLKTNKTRDNAKKASELVDALDDSNPYKEYFKELLKEIGVGVPLNIEAGYHEFYYGDMRYYVYFPPDATTNMPVLLWLHGDNYREEWAKNVKFCKTAYNAGIPVMVVVPFVGRVMGHSVPGWAEGGLLPTVKALLDDVCDRYECDRTNINVGGHSRGAIGTWKMVSDYPNYFHAAAPVSCCAFAGLTPSSFTGMKIWAVRGSGAGSGYENDDNYACMGDNINKVKQYVREWKYQILPHTKHGEATDELQLSAEFAKFMFTD